MIAAPNTHRGRRHPIRPGLAGLVLLLAGTIAVRVLAELLPPIAEFAPRVSPSPGVALQSLRVKTSRANRPPEEVYVYIAVVDLKIARVRMTVVAEDVRPPEEPDGFPIGTGHGAAEWCRRHGALVGVNAGFFRPTSDPSHKAIVGLLVQGKRILGKPIVKPSQNQHTREVARCALGFTSRDEPRINWVRSSPELADQLLAWESPTSPGKARPWLVESAVAAGPRLVRKGQVYVTAWAERLLSPRYARRTFVAFDREANAPRRVVIGVTNSMSYPEVASFLHDYFPQFHRTRCEEAMCLDGGSSSQLAYRTADGKFKDVLSPVAKVPTAVLVVPQ